MNHEEREAAQGGKEHQPMWRRYLRMIRPNPAADLDDELRDHLESSIARLVRQGMSRESARNEAIRRFGDLRRVRADVSRIDAAQESRVRRAGAIETFVYDVKHGARGLRRNPVFTGVAAISIALGVAANASVFSVVNALLLRPIPGTHVAGLNRMYVNHHSPFEWSELNFFRQNTQTLAAVVGERNGTMSFRAFSGADAERVRGSYVTSGFFSSLGVRPAVGRLFDVDESERVGMDPVVMLSHAFWQHRFGGDSSIIGRSVIVGEQPLTVVGVVSPAFRSSVVGWAPQIFVPFAMAPSISGQPLAEYGGSFYATARLRESVPRATVDAELREVMARLARTDSARYEGRTVRLDHIRGVHAELRGPVAAGSIFLMAMVGLVLLIACANVANLMLGRAAARRTEMGVRLAIGASRGRLVRQLLTESLLVTALGTAVGVLAAWSVTRALPAALPPEAGVDAKYLAPDFRVLGFAALLCLATTLLCGLVPSLRAASPNLVGMLKAVASDAARRRRRGLLVSAQTAMCVVLLAAAAFFMRALTSASTVDPGFDARGVVDARLDLSLLPPDADRAAIFALIQKRAAQLPGVQTSSMTAVVPLSGNNMETRILQEGVQATSRFDGPGVYFNVVAPKFFATLRTPLIRGREFSDADREGGPRVAVINETAARRFWPDEEALGKRFHFGSVDGPLVQVVGIARDANYVMPGESPKVTVYVPHAQQPRTEMVLLLRTTADMATTRRAVWQMMREIAPGLPPAQVAPMSDDIAATLLPVRVGAALLGTFGVIALVLATAGIYGVASYSVASRTREIGVRAALGATRAAIMRMVLVESGLRVAIGVAAGLVATIGIGVVLSKVIYGVTPADPVVLGSVVSGIGLVALMATFAPARRASRADPVVAMRAE